MPALYHSRNTFYGHHRKTVQWWTGVVIWLCSVAANADWYYINFNKSDTADRCIALSAEETPKQSIADHAGANVPLFSQHTWPDGGRLEVYMTGSGTQYAFTSNRNACEELYAALTLTADGAVYLNGDCERPKYSGSVAMEVAAAKANWGPQVKVVTETAQHASLLFKAPGGETHTIRIFEAHEQCENGQVQGSSSDSRESQTTKRNRYIDTPEGTITLQNEKCPTGGLAAVMIESRENGGGAYGCWEEQDGFIYIHWNQLVGPTGSILEADFTQRYPVEDAR